MAELDNLRRLLGPGGHHADGGHEVAQLFITAVVETDGFAALEPLGERGRAFGQCGIFAGQFVVSRGAVFCVGLNGRDAGIERFLRDSNIPCVDLSTDLRAEGDFHWSVQGHAFVADKIEKFLLCSKMF